MTEYDYSPAAYERYLAQQARVSNWVNDTVQQSHSYSNPFVLSPTLRDRSFYDQPDDGDYAPRHNDQWSNSSRPSRSRSRSYADHAHYDRTPPSRHRSQSHSRSSSTPRDIFYQPHGGQQPIYPQPHAPGQRRHTSPPRNYHYAPPNHSPTRQAYGPQPPPPGQIYHNAPGPVPNEPHHRHASHSRHPSSKPPPQPYLLVQGGGPKAEYKRGPAIHAPIPTKAFAAQPPLLKRLFGFVTNSPVGGRSGNGRGFRGSSY